MGLSLLAQSGRRDSHLHFARARSEPAERLGHLLRIISRLVKEDPEVGVHQHADRQAQKVLCGEGQDRVGSQQKDLDRLVTTPAPSSLLKHSPLVTKMGYQPSGAQGDNSRACFWPRMSWGAVLAGWVLWNHLKVSRDGG